MAAAMDVDTPSGTNSGAGKKRFEVKKWNAVALWAWDIVVDNCAICRNHIMDLSCFSFSLHFPMAQNKAGVSLGQQRVGIPKVWALEMTLPKAHPFVTRVVTHLPVNYKLDRTVVFFFPLFLEFAVPTAILYFVSNKVVKFENGCCRVYMEREGASSVPETTSKSVLSSPEWRCPAAASSQGHRNL